MTLDGTNTWILSAPGSGEAIVVDPGPDDPAHLDAVLRRVEEASARVVVTLLTHGHLDHSEAARAFAGRTGAPVRALDPYHRIGAEGLLGGDVVAIRDLEVRVVPTPGHTADSLSFLLPADCALLTGDSVLGRGSTVVAYPDGRLADYLESLDRLAELARSGRATTILPGHGPALPDAVSAIAHYQHHRAERLRQVVDALDSGATTPFEVVERVYSDVDRSLWPAAELSVRAQLDYLAQAGKRAGSAGQP